MSIVGNIILVMILLVLVHLVSLCHTLIEKLTVMKLKQSILDERLSDYIASKQRR